MECSVCINTDDNPSITISGGLCNVCRDYTIVKSFQNDREHGLKQLEAIKNRSDKCVIGLSGGKDSSAMAYEVFKMGFKAKAFTLDTAYYPYNMFIRARKVAYSLDMDHDIVDVRKDISDSCKKSYELTADWYDTINSPDLFRSMYGINRLHYSVKDQTQMPFVRTCILCRKSVIPAYCKYAIENDVETVFLGINEWASLSKGASFWDRFSGIRRIFINNKTVNIVHLPYILGSTIETIKPSLDAIGWTPPDGENLIESNYNSCLFAAAAEHKATQMLGFHPDTTRLAREVTVGFITKQQAKDALEISKQKKFPLTVREVLKKAFIIQS